MTHLPSGLALFYGLEEEQAEAVFEWLKLNARWIGRTWTFGGSNRLHELPGGERLARMARDLMDDMAEAVSP